MNMIGTWESKDGKYLLKVLSQEGSDYSISLKMPLVVTPIEGILKNGEVANLKFEVNNTPVYVYLFTHEEGENKLSIKGTGRSTGRFQGDIPSTDLIKIS